MPVYGTPPGTPVAIYPGDFPFPLFGTGSQGGPFAGEIVTAGEKSIAMARGVDTWAGNTYTTFEILWLAAGTCIIQGANQDVDASYVTLYTSTSVTTDNYTDVASWSFYRVLSSSNGTLLVLAKR